MGIQACNLNNLPENNKMSFCKLSFNPFKFLVLLKLRRLLAYDSLATNFLCGRRSQGKDCWVHSGQDVRY